MKLVGLDLGTSGVRYECYGLDGAILSRGRADITEQSCRGWMDAILRAIPKEKGFEDSEEVLLSGQSTSGTAVLVDEYGNEVLRPLMYFERAPEESKKIERLSSVKELAKRGVAISSTSPLPKIVAIREKQPDAFRRVRWVIAPLTWLLHRLRYREDVKWEDVTTDLTNALKFGVDLVKSYLSWYAPVFRDAGIPTHLLPRIVRCGEEIGIAESDFAERLGLRGARIFQGMTDGNAGALAVGCLNENDFGFTCGTTTAVKYVTGTIKMHKAIYYHKHPFEGYLAGAAPVTAGMLDWYAKKIMGITVDEAFTLSERIPPEKEYGFFPQGERSPFNDPELGGSFIKIWPDEIPVEEARGRLFRSIVTGLTFFEHYYIQLFERLFDNKITEAKITGGGTRSPWWNKLRAAIYDIPVKVMEERPGIGALIPAVVSLNLLKREEVVQKLLRVMATYLPDRELKGKYESRKRLFFKSWTMIRKASALG